jgi:hypothetical protein
MNISKFYEFINEDTKIKFSFYYNDESISFQEATKKSIFIKIINWLSNNNYEFENKSGQFYYPTIIENIPPGHRQSHYYKIPNINKFININLQSNTLILNF